MLPIRITVSRPEFMSPGYTFLSVRRRAIGRPPDLSPAQREFGTGWGMLVALDARGRVRWLRKLPRRPAGLVARSSGTLFYNDTESCAREVAMDGRVLQTWYAEGRPQEPPDGGTAVATRTLHHLPDELPNGNFPGTFRIWSVR